MSLVLITFVLSLTGCFKTTGSFNEEDPSTVSFEGIQFKAKRYSVYVNKQLQIPERDLKGKAPFTFSLDQGIGTIDQATGLYQAPSVLGFAVVSIKDADGRLGYISIEVIDDLRVKNTDFSMVTGTSYLLQISGGKFPFSFLIDQGSVTVNELGVVTAGMSEGPAVVRVVDSSGNSATVNIAVVKNLTISPSQFSVSVSGSKDLTLSGGVGVAQLSLNSGTGVVSNNPPRYTANTTTGTAVVSATDEMGNVGYAYGQVFGVLQISPHLMKIPKGESFNHFEALGGVPPFTFSIQGSGTINATTGQYTAPAQEGTDIITVTDALGHTSQATITVTTATRFFAKNAILQLGDTLDLVGQNLIEGGTAPYTLSVASGQGSIAGSVYTPPTTLGNYTITIQDNAGQSTQSIILVYPSFSIAPAQLNIAVDTQDFFSAIGGVPPYTFQVLSGLGSIDAQTGAYSSGSTVGTAIVRVTDAQGHTAQANVQIKNKLSLVADVTSIEGGGTVNFTASGGVSPYTFSIINGGGTLTPVGSDKAALVTGLNAGIVQIEAKDSVGNRLSSYVQVLAKLSPIPPTLSLKVNQQYFFGAQGGLGPYQFQGISGTGTISSDGLYKAASKASTDKIRVTDSAGRTADASILVYENMQMSPQSKTILIGQSLSMTVTGGVAPITYSITSGPGSITQQGLFTAGSTPGTVVIHASDKEGNFADSVIAVNSALEIIPTAASLKTNKTFGFAASGGIAPYKYSVTGGSSGTINTATGEYTAPNTAGNYQVQVRDAENNVALATVTVSNGGNGNNTPSSGPADHLLMLGGNNQTGTVNSVLASSFQIKVVDSAGVGVANTSLKVTVVSGTGTAGQSTLMTGADGVATVPYFLGTTSGTESIRIESNTTAFPGSPASLDFTATAIPAAPSSFNSTIAATSTTGVPADGTTTSTITVTLKDLYGNLVPNATVILQASGTGNTLVPSGTTTNSSGQFTATLTSTVPEIKNVTFNAPAALSSLSLAIGFGPTGNPDSTKSTIAASTNNVVADGVSAATIAIQLKANDDSPVAGFVPTFSATDSSGTNTYGTCSLTDSGGNSNCSLKSTKAETKILTITSPVSKTGGTVTFTHGPPIKLSFSQQPVSAAINSALSPQPIVELQDAYGNRVNGGTEASAPVSLTLISGVGIMAGTGTLSASAGVADFSGKNIAFDRAGTKVIRASLGAFSVDSLPFGITSTPTLIQWSGATSINRGSCSSLSLSVYDAGNDLTPTANDINISLSGGGNGGFFAENTCTTPIVSATLPQGSSTKVIYYKNNTAESVSLTSNATGFTQSTYAVTVIPGSASLLSWSSTANRVAPGVCSAVLNISTKDLSGQAAPVGANTTITLGGQGSGAFYSDGSCSSAITSTNIPNGGNATTVYFKDSISETLVLTASASGLTQGSFNFTSKFPELYLSGTGGSTLNGVPINSCGGSDSCNSANPYVITNNNDYSEIVMVNGARLTGAPWTSGLPTTSNGLLILNVYGPLNICSGCTVDMNGAGYTSTNGPGGTATANWATGASYGGVGGVGYSNGAAKAVYGSITAPTDLGSGGGNLATCGGLGGKGGGAIRLNVTGVLTLNGLIAANGTNGDSNGCAEGGGGGTGGSVQIITSTLGGSTGTLSANGGNGGNAAGGGSGGRIAVTYSNDSYTGGINTLGLSAYGGGTWARAGAGTIYLLHSGVQTNGQLIVNNNGNSGGTTPLLTNSNFDRLDLKNKGNLEIPTGMTLQTANPVFNDGILTNNGSYLNALSTIANLNLVNNGSLNIPNGDLTISSGGTLTFGGTNILNLNSLVIQSGGLLTHLQNTTSKSYLIDINITNNFQLDAGASINLNGKGYLAGNGPGSSATSANASGGSFGGLGGKGGSNVTPGSAYSDYDLPFDLGSAGGNTGSCGNRGGSGGGAARIIVGGTLTLNGTLTANGTDGTNSGCTEGSGGGSGGSFQIVTATLAGATGSIAANGGNGSSVAGGGGGGRISLKYSTASYAGGVNALPVTAYGGGFWAPGGAGTIFKKHLGAETYGELIVNNNNNAGSTTHLGASASFDRLIVKNKGNLANEIAQTLSFSSLVGSISGLLTNAGTINPGSSVLSGLELINTGTVNFPGNNLTIDSGATLTVGNSNLTLANLIILSGGQLTHMANATTQASVLNLTVSGNLQVDAGASINLDGKGYATASGPATGGAGVSNGAGGSGGGHGSAGGANSSANSGGIAYDASSGPLEIGAGGGNGNCADTGTGGGAARINVAGTMTFNGAITANGQSGSASCRGGGGAGGSLWITTASLAGSSGVLRADGGNVGYTNAGTGAGGRIKLEVTTDNYTGTVASLLKSANGGSGSTAAGGNASAGSISVSAPTPSGTVADHLVLIAGNNQSGTVMTVLPISLQIKVVDSNNAAVPNVALKVTVTSGSGNPGYSTVTSDANGLVSVPYFLGSVAGNDTIRIESNGTAFPGTPAYLDYTATATPGSPSTSTSTIAGTPNSAIPADGTTVSNLTATIKDLYGNVIPNVTVTLAASGSGNTLSQNTTTTDSNGQITATLKTTVAENKTVSFTAPAALSSLNTVIGFGTTVVPDATTSTISGTSNVVADGIASSTITINLKSATNVAAAGFVPTFSATDTNGTNTYGACSLSDGSGNSTCTLKSTKAETKLLTILTPVNKTGLSVTFVNGATDHLAFTQQPVGANINTALSPQPVVEIQDAYNNRVTTGADATAAVSLSLISGTGALSGTTSMSAVAGIADFNGKNIAFTRAGSKTLKATMGTITLNSNPVAISSTPTQLTWSGSSSLVRGTCGSLTLSTYDASNDLTNTSSDLNINLGGAGVGSYYSDNACSTPIVSTTIAQGTNNKTFYFKSATSGSYSFTADAAGLPQSPFAMAVIAGSPAKLAWSGATYVGAGYCSTALTITVQDSTNQATTVPANTTVTLGGKGSGFFYSDAGCSNVIPSIDIATGNSTATVYFKDGLGESLLLTADSTGLAQGSYAFQTRYPVLYLSGTGGSTIDGVAITSCGGGSSCNSTNPYLINVDSTYYSITMANGAYMSATGYSSGTPAPGNGKLQVSTTTDFTICDTCFITMVEKGYRGLGPGRGLGSGGAGGHGGKGGDQGSALMGGPPHDSALNPTDLGGAGWVGNEGPGGGLIKLTVGGTLTLNGSLLVNGGAYCCNQVAGAGGSINIVTNSIAGTGGIIRANGGVYATGSSGGGGRIAIQYTNDNYTGGFSSLTVEAFGGNGNNQGGYGGAGTIFYKHVGVDTVGHLIIKNHSGSLVANNWYNNYLPTTPLLSEVLTTNFNSITVGANTILEINSGTFNLPTANTLDFPLFLNGGSLGNIPSNDLNITSTGVLFLSGNDPVSFNNLTVNGGLYQWYRNSTTPNYKIDVTTTGNLTLGSTGIINATEMGYRTGGPGRPSAAGASGAHGGKGGDIYRTKNGGTPYDSTTNPADLGGGGWNGNEQPGGGLIKLTVGNTLTLSGQILANGGAYCCNEAGGAGGTVNIITNTISGNGGRVKVNGGVYANRSSGGGGRIAIQYTNDSYTGGFAGLSLQAYGGIGGNESGHGGAGTIFYKRNGVDTVGHLVIKNDPAFTFTNQYYPPASTELLTDIVTTNFDSVTIGSNTLLELKAGTFNLPTAGVLNFPLLLNGGTLGNMPNNDLTISSNGVLWLSGSGTNTFNNLTIDGKVYQWNYNSTTPTYKLLFNILNNLTLSSTGTINANYRGYTTGGPGRGIQGSGNRGGGGHGGTGGIQDTGAVGGPAHDSLMNPSDLGGANSGSENGGGLIDITVGGIFTLNGSLYANGIGSDGGAAGGTVKINTATLAGSTGLIQANGGTGNYGSGGGGRIAIYYTTDNYTSGIAALLANTQAYGGTSGVNGGGAGTIFYKHVGTDTVGRLLIKNNPAITLNNSVVLPSMTEYPSDLSGTTFDGVTIASNSTLELKSGIFNLPTAGVLDFPVFLNGGTLGNIPNNDLNITSTGTLWLPGLGTQTFNNLTVSGNIYQFNYNQNSLVYKTVLNVTNNLTLNATGKINVNGRGYTTGGPGRGSSSNGNRGGGGHGGTGGIQASGGVGGAVHDSVTNPNDLGGGSNESIAGGGLLDITVGANFTLNGSLLANSAVSSSSGAGGTIKLTTNTLLGSTGLVQANGLNGTYGSGGGGRIAIYYTNDSYSGGVAALTKQVSGGISGTVNGSQGTIYVAPKLNLNFTSGSLPASVSFSRASSGSYYNASGTLSVAAAQQPRFDFDPSNNSALGLLIEPQRTNEVLYSEDLSQANWTKQDVTLSSGSLAPDGTTVPYKISENTNNNFHAIGGSPILVSNQDYVLSFYAKAIERNWLAVYTLNQANAAAESYINLATGTTGTVQHSKVNVQPINNGWYRVFVKFNAGAGATNPIIAVGTASADASKTYAGTAGNGLYLWGLQLEVGAYGTSYIKTTTSTATRSADVATVSDLSWLIGGTSSLGTFVMDLQIPFIEYNMPFMQLDNNSSSSSHRIGINSSTFATRYLMNEASTSYIDITNGSWADGNRKKVCAGFKTGTGVLSTGGASVTKATPSTVANTGLSTLRLGADHVATSFSGHILSLQYSQDLFNDETCKQISQ